MSRQVRSLINLANRYRISVLRIEDAGEAQTYGIVQTADSSPNGSPHQSRLPYSTAIAFRQRLI